jgi:DeoR/GlpR family transcriptional regulator of sugar metabolism
MLPAQRHAEILRRLRSSGPNAVDELAVALGVSRSTIRRDLGTLSQDGRLRRVHGGAAVRDDADERRPFTRVLRDDVAEKEQVAACAATLVGDGDVVLLDIGTTTLRLAAHLRGRHVTVITSSLAVLDVLHDDSEVELVLLGGVVREAYRSLVGALTEASLREVRATHAFLGTSGVTADGVVLDSTRVEVPVKRAMMRAAERVVLLADLHKFPGTGALKVCEAEDLDVLVTNQGADESTVRRCREAGVEVVFG